MKEADPIKASVSVKSYEFPSVMPLKSYAVLAWQLAKYPAFTEGASAVENKKSRTRPGTRVRRVASYHAVKMKLKRSLNNNKLAEYKLFVKNIILIT